jgi:DNA-binding Xre family transcriptional regulator
MSLHQAIQTAMQAKGLKMGDLLARIPQRDRSTIYRLLSGDTRDARVSTLLALCSALGVTPDELLSLAGFWSEAERVLDPLDLRLRKVLTMVEGLVPPYKLVAVTQVERLMATWQEAAEGSLGREEPSKPGEAPLSGR